MMKEVSLGAEADEQKTQIIINITVLHFGTTKKKKKTKPLQRKYLMFPKSNKIHKQYKKKLTTWGVFIAVKNNKTTWLHCTWAIK